MDVAKAMISFVCDWLLLLLLLSLLKEIGSARLSESDVYPIS